MAAMVTVESLTDKLVDFIRNTYKNNKEIIVLDIVLDTLISNSACALDRLQFECSTVPPPVPFINIIPDKTNNMLTIVDNGVGMTMADLVDLAFLSRSRFNMLIQGFENENRADLNFSFPSALWFYFACLVADKVVVTTKNCYHQQYVWEYEAGVSSMVTVDTYDHTLVCGSSITLYLKWDQRKYLEGTRLKDLITKHSIHSSFPISLHTETSEISGKYSSRFFNKSARHLSRVTLKAGSSQDELLSLMRDTFENTKEIFLHLLILNSSLALDKLESEPEPEPVISIIPRKFYNTLTIFNNGVGMTKADLLKMSTFAENRNMFKQAISSGDYSIISQSGFAFYLASLVADKVVVRTKHLNDEGYVWTLQAEGPSTITRDTSLRELDRGSKMILHLKEDQLKYLDHTTLKDLILKYSSNIKHEISISFNKTSEAVVPFVEYEDEDEDEDEDVDMDMDMDMYKDEDKDMYEGMHHMYENEDEEEDEDEDEYAPYIDKDGKKMVKTIWTENTSHIIKSGVLRSPTTEFV